MLIWVLNLHHLHHPLRIKSRLRLQLKICNLREIKREKGGMIKDKEEGEAIEESLKDKT